MNNKTPIGYPYIFWYELDTVALLLQPLGYLTTNRNIEQKLHGVPATETASTVSFATRGACIGKTSADVVGFKVGVVA